MEEVKKQTNPYLQAFVILLPSILALVATSATNVCQPNIAGYFGATQYEANTVITSYIIANGIMLPTTGFLAKVFGKKMFFMYCITFFCLGALFCILARDLHMLILARIFQGIGGGCILPLCQAMLLDIFPDKKGLAMALFGVAAMFAPLAGPFFGGYLTDNWSWQWVFIINIPLCLISLALIKFFVPKDEPVKEKYNKKFDIVGFAGIAAAMGCMQIVLDKGEQFNWFDTTWICWLTGISIFSFIFFYVWELEYKYPIIDIRVFKDKNFLCGTAISSIINVLLYSTLLLVPLFSQSLIGYSPSASGLTMFPRAVVCLAGLLIMGEIAKYVENRILTAIGFTIMASAAIWMSCLNTTASMYSIVLPNLLLCFGVSVAFVPITALSFLTLPKNKTADAAGLHALFKNIVTAISTSASSTFIARGGQVYQNNLVEHLAYHNPAYRVHLSALQHKFMMIYPSVVAHKKASGMLYKQLLQQAKLGAFYDAFLCLAMLAMLTIPFLLLLKTKSKKSSA